MSRKYKMHDPEGMYFISFATINWIDVFVREEYFGVITDSLNYCIENKGLIVYGYCIMPSHIHLIFRDSNNDPSKLLKELKAFTSKEMKKEIDSNPHESRKDWILQMMKEAGSKKSNVKSHQFWQQHNKPIELWSNHVIDQKLDYIHNNPVEAGFVDDPVHWKYSSARDYAGIKSYVNIVLIE
ncbi:MAG: transposase [Bacteroidales bacterium]|nr:transposase [Bacteroidales bacterium]